MSQLGVGGTSLYKTGDRSIEAKYLVEKQPYYKLQSNPVLKKVSMLKMYRTKC